MHLSIQHSTHYSYSSPVTDSFNDARLCPVSDELQLCKTFNLSVTPTTTQILRRLDFYTNQVHHFSVTAPHKTLHVVSESAVQTYTDTRDFTVPSPQTSLHDLETDERFYDFLISSERVQLSPVVIHEATALLHNSLDVQDLVKAIMAYIYDNFTYDVHATGVETPMCDALQKRRGVCQDFAHIMTGFCRALKIPTRYVSGYFYAEKVIANTADDNTESHAWVECFLPNIGWVGYDPTHNRQTNSCYIKIAIGRDYTDVRPLSGSFRGTADAELSVSVQIQQIIPES